MWVVHTWVRDTQLIGRLLVHSDLVPDIQACFDLYHRIGVPLLAAIKGRAVQLLSRLNRCIVCDSMPVVGTFTSASCGCTFEVC